jgi:membrane protease YdiL (CAAX protease family)
MENANNTNRIPRYPDPSYDPSSSTAGDPANDPLDGNSGTADDVTLDSHPHSTPDAVQPSDDPASAPAYGPTEGPADAPAGSYTYTGPSDAPAYGITEGPADAPAESYSYAGPSDAFAGPSHGSQSPVDSRPYGALPAAERAKQAYRAVDKLSLWLILMTIGIQVVVAVIINIMTLMGHTASFMTVMAVQLLPMYIVSYPLTLYFYRRVPSLVPRIRSLGAGRFIKYLLACFPVMYIGNLIGNAVTSPFNGGGTEQVLNEFLTTTTPLQVLLVVILAPVFEELIFRKAIIDRVGRYGELTAIVLSALTFGLFHMNLIQFFYAFGLGVIFAYLYLNTGRVRYTIMLHMIINFFGSVVSSAAFSGVSDDTWTKFDQFQHGTIGFSELSPFLPQLILPVLFILLIIVLSITGIIVIITNLREIRLRPTPDEVPLKVAIPAAYLNAFFIIVAVICLGNMILTLFIS